ncbi:MAG: terminase family protein [Bacteroidales bacterium]|jgi:phage terminase large subunit-like protein
MSSRQIELILPETHEAQQQILDEAKRFNVEVCGRRFGKTQLDIFEALPVVLEGNPVGVMFPTYKMLSEVWREFVNVFAPLKRNKNEQEHRLELVTGGVIEMWSAEAADAVRGRKYQRFIFDEIAMVPNLLEIWNAIIRPTLVDLKGDAYFKSTPKGRNGFWQLFQLGQDDNNPEWKSWQFPTSANPTIPASEIEAMQATMPEIIFRQEILADFIDDNAGVFRRVQEAAVLQPREPQAGRQYVAGVDVAASVDFTVVSVMDAESKEMVYMDRFNRVDYPVLIDRLESVYSRYGLTSMVVEANSIGRPVIDELVTRGLNIVPFTTTSATKQSIIQGLQAAFENAQIKIVNNPVLVGELLSFESKRNPSGGFSYSAPAGMHDDCVMSLAFAWNAISADRWFFSSYD